MLISVEVNNRSPYEKVEVLEIENKLYCPVELCHNQLLV